MNKMGLFIQPPGAGMDLIAKYKPAAALLMGATSQHIREARNASPQTDILVWWHEDWRHWSTTDPIWYADHIAAGIKDCKPDAVAFWNENLSHDHHHLFADYDARQAAYIDRMQGYHGIPVGGFAMAEGNFTKDGPNLVECFPKSLARLQYIFIHEYWFPRIRSEGMEGFHCLRWPEWMKWLDKAGLDHILFYVTECGLTSLINEAGGDEGWLGHVAKDYGVTDEAYFDDLAYYHARCCQESRIKAVIPFLAVSYAGEWETFRLTRNPALLDRIMALDAPGPSPVPQPPPPVPPPEPPEETMTIQVIDENKQVLSPEAAAAYMARYGIKYREPTGLKDGDWYWKLIKLEWKPTAAWIFTVLDENGNPVANQQTAWGWYKMTDADDIKGDHYATDWYKRADLGPTNANGHCGPAMSKDWYHDEYEPGPGYAWIRDPNRPSTVVEDIGMLGGTAHFTLIGTWQLKQYVGDGNGGDGDLVFVERIVTPHVSAMLGIAVPTDYAVEHDLRGDFRGPGVDETIHPTEWDHPDGTRMALVEGCANFDGDEAREFTMQAIDIGSGEKLTDVIPDIFEPLGAPRKRIVHVFAVGGPEPPTPPLELKEAVNRLRELISELQAITDYLASL